MIFLLHGENLALLEKALTELKKTVPSEKLEFDAQDITPAQFLDKARTFDIFQNPPFIVLRFTKTVDALPFYNTFDQIPPETKIVLVTPFTLGVTHVFIKNPKKYSIKEASVNQKKNADMFRFLDAVYLQKRNLAHNELQTLLEEGNDPFYIFSMLLYGLRNVFFVKFNSPELAEMKDFSKKKAQSQAGKFEEEDILSLFDYMQDLDKKVKTGQIPTDLLNFLAVEKILSYTKT
jgi:DNA polymerase III delta subunit